MTKRTVIAAAEYGPLLSGISTLLREARRAAARSVNTILTVTYWEVGRQIVEFEQMGTKRAKYGAELLQRLSGDLTARFGRGFSVDNLENMRLFYLGYPSERISEALSRKLPDGISETASRTFSPTELASQFTLSWSHYVLLLKRSRSAQARMFYESEALRCGWSVRQLERQIGSQFYERTAFSPNQTVMRPRSTQARL